MAWKLVVSPTPNNFFAVRRKYMRSAINSALEAAEKEIKQKYKEYTNKSTGKRIRSEHISEMLETSIRTVGRGRDPYADRYVLRAWVAGSTKWLKIAQKQEVGGAIYPKKSKLLTIPNVRGGGIAPGARAGHFRERATWINLGGKPFLVRERFAGKKGKWPPARKPMKPRRTRRTRTRVKGRPGYPGRDILFLGVKSVYLKPKEFFARSMQDASAVIEKKYGNDLKREIERT